MFERLWGRSDDGALFLTQVHNNPGYFTLLEHDCGSSTETREPGQLAQTVQKVNKGGGRREEGRFPSSNVSSSTSFLVRSWPQDPSIVPQGAPWNVRLCLHRILEP